MPAGPNELNDQQRKFVRNLVEGKMSKGEAYRRAYPEVKSIEVASAAACNSLKIINVKQYYEKLKRKAEKLAVISVAEVLAEEKRLALSDIGELFRKGEFSLIPPHELPEDVRRAVASVKVKEDILNQRTYEYKFWDKGAALARLEKHLGMYEADNEQQKPAPMTEEMLQMGKEIADRLVNQVLSVEVRIEDPLSLLDDDDEDALEG